MKRYAIILGCEEYNNYSDTLFCHNDVDLLYETLTKYCDFANQDIYVSNLHPSTDTSPDKILAEIEDKIKESKQGDTILFYYAGHGHYYKGESYLILPNTDKNNIEKTALPLRNISEKLRKNGRFNIRIFDACHSGQDVRTTIESNLNTDDFINDITSNIDGWVTFAACKENEYSYPDASINHGIFTFYLAEAIKEHPLGDIYIENIKISVCSKIEKWCNSNLKYQTPTMNMSIPGNVSMAIRKQEILIANNNLDERIDDKNLLALKINDLRGVLIDASSFNNDSYHNLLEKLKEQFERYIGKIEMFGLQANEITRIPVDDSNQNIKKLIVSYIKKENLNTSHHIDIIREYTKDQRPAWMRTSLFPFKPELISTEYIIEENIMDYSLIHLEIPGDDILNHSDLFIYCCPLELKILFFYCFEIKGTESKTFQLQFFLDKSREIDFSIIDNKIEFFIKRFNEEYALSIKRRIEYLERELNL